MSIIRHEFPKSRELEEEMQLHQGADSAREADRYATPEEFIRSFPNKAHQFEVEQVCTRFKTSSRVLDIGVGVGHTSIMFALAGHQVTVVEPSYELCVAIDSIAKKFGMEIPVHQCSMEYMDIPQRFDQCVFNASFHHCDDPMSALKKCHSLLVDGGKVYLVNEQVLKFYRTKKWYDTARRKHPKKVCDYGGNEHNYRLHEYRTMLIRANFRIAEEKIPSYYLYPKEMLKGVLSINDHFKKSSGTDIYSDANILLRCCYYMVLKRLVSNRWWCGLLKRLSFITVTFIGKKE